MTEIGGVLLAVRNAESDPDLTPRERMGLIRSLTHGGAEHGGHFEAFQTIADAWGCCYKTVIRTYASLVAKGKLVKTARANRPSVFHVANAVRTRLAKPKPKPTYLRSFVNRFTRTSKSHDYSSSLSGKSRGRSGDRAQEPAPLRSPALVMLGEELERAKGWEMGQAEPDGHWVGLLARCAGAEGVRYVLDQWIAAGRGPAVAVA